MRYLPDPFVKHPRAVIGDLRGRTMIVTGASPGSIGFETARALADAGARVVVTSRSKVDATVDALRRAARPDAGARIEGLALDLADASSVRAFVAAFTAAHDRLDVLVNNAGIHLDLRSKATAPTLTDDGYEVHLRTNYLGTAQLTHALLSMLRDTAKQDPRGARIVFVVSHLHRRGRNAAIFGRIAPFDSWVAYGTSKLALMHFCVELERRFGGEGLHAVSLHPGSVFTKIADRGLEGNPWLERVRRWLAPIEARILLTPDEGAQTTLTCATTTELVPGAYYERCAPDRPSDELAAAGFAEHLWDTTLERLATLR